MKREKEREREFLQRKDAGRNGKRKSHEIQDLPPSHPGSGRRNATPQFADMINTRNDSGIRPFPLPSPRSSSAFRVNHVRRVNPLIKTALRPFLLLLLLKEDEYRVLGRIVGRDAEPSCMYKAYIQSILTRIRRPSRLSVFSGLLNASDESRNEFRRLSRSLINSRILLSIACVWIIWRKKKNVKYN